MNIYARFNGQYGILNNFRKLLVDNWNDLELDETQTKILCPGEHLQVEFLAGQTEQVELHSLSDLADLVPQLGVGLHPRLELVQGGVRGQEGVLVPLRLAREDVPVAVVHQDVGPGTHRVRVKDRHGLANWNII